MPFRFVDEKPATPVENPNIVSQEESNGKYRFVEEEPSRLRSLVSAAPKGFAKELRQQLTHTLGFLPKTLGLEDKDTQLSPVSDEEFYEKIENLLPTRENFAEQALERGGKIAPYAAIGGGNLAGQGLRSALAGFLGQGAEEAGLPPWAQALAELPAFAGPNLGKKILPTKSQKELVEGARKLGLSEKEIAPLIQGENKQRFLSKVVPRRGKTKKTLDKSYQALGKVYNRLSSSPIAEKTVAPELEDKILESFGEQIKKFPSDLRNLIKEDLSDLASGPISGTSLINFYQDLNHYIGKGHTKLGILKEPFYKAMNEISPELSRDFRLTNTLYSKYHNISGKLKPNLVDDLFSAATALKVIGGASLGNLPVLIETIGEHGARSLARELLLNPRLQNLSKKMMNALSSNKYAVANRFLKDFKEEIGKTDPEISKIIEGADFDELKKKH